MAEKVPGVGKTGAEKTKGVTQNQEKASGPAAKRKRGSKSASIKDNLQNIQEGDIGRIVRESWQYFNRKPPKDNAEMAERLNDYFRQCNEGQIPTVEDMALALGVTRQTLWEWENVRRVNPERANMIKKAKEIMAGIDAKLAAEGKIPQVVYIFRAKNFYGMKDQQDVVVTPNVDPLGDRRSEEELTQKYLDSVKGAGMIEQKNDEFFAPSRVEVVDAVLEESNPTDP